MTIKPTVRASAADEIDEQTAGLWVHRSGVPAMREFHRHDDLEINVVLDGQLDYLFGGRQVTVPRGHTALFWAAAPHRLITVDPRRVEDPGPRSTAPAGSDVCWIHVPLRTVLRWRLPAHFAAEVLAQRTVIVPTSAVADHVESQFGTWQRDLVAGVEPSALLLEANALVLRILAAHAEAEVVGARSGTGSREDLLPVAGMARFIAERFRDPITGLDIARSVGLNPNYATTLFRRSVGVTLGEHLLRHRIAEAQRLLITTELTTTTIAYAAGFGSASSLYAHFARTCGCAPGEYRASRTAA